MPQPRYLDPDLNLPLGGVNGFELNGHAVNGVGFTDNPFVDDNFALDPYRSILPEERGDSDESPILPSLLDDERSSSVQVVLDTEAIPWAPRVETTVACERASSDLAVDPLSLALEVEGISVVPAECNTAYVLADHPSTTGDTRADSHLGELPPSTEPDQIDVSYVPAEDRTTKVRRI